MTQLKKVFFALAVVVSLGLVGASDAFAQASCTANSVPTLIRSQGLTELTGSIVLSACSGAIPAAGASLTATIQPPTAVITNGTAAVPPGTAGFVPTIVITTQGLGADGVPGTADDPAAVVGAATAATALSGNTVTFAVTATPAASRLVSIQIGVVPGIAATVGIRVNANASGIVFPGQIAALLTSSPPGTLSITNNLLNVAIPLPGLVASFSTVGAVTQCAVRAIRGTPPATGGFTPTYTAGVLTGSTNTAAGWGVIDPATLATAAPSAVQRITVTEGFATAFQTAGAGGEGTDTSVGTGTQLIIRLTNLPSNVVIYAPNQLANGVAAAGPYAAPTFELTLIGGAGPVAASGTVGALGQTGSTLVGATIIYQVTAETDSAAETISIPISFFTTGTPAPSGTVSGSVALAPISNVGTAVPTATAPIPRFVDLPISGNLVTIVPCVTNVFFPFVTNQVGFDTGFAIANTTTDVFGTTSQSGTCVYNFFGDKAPSGGTFTTAAFGGGTTDTRVLSVIAAGFQGYVIAVCNFQLGHGFFFIVNNFGTGVPTLAEGSPALIIAQPIATGTGTGTRVAAASVALVEALGH